MATHDYVIDNSTGANVRADLNNALQAIVTNNSTSDIANLPATFPFMLVADTSAGTMKIRNAGNTAFIELFQLDGTLTLEDGTNLLPALAFRTDVDTGIFRSAENKFNVATGGVERMELGTTTIFNETGADVDFRIEGDTDDNLFYLDASNNRIGIGTSSPASKLFVVGNSTFDDGTNARIDIGGISSTVGRIVATTTGFAAFTNLQFRGSSIDFANSTGVAMTLDSSGNLAVGLTSSPASSSTEQGVFLSGVDGAGSVFSSSSEGIIVNRVGTGGNDRNNIKLKNNGNERGVIGTIGASDGIYLDGGTAGVELKFGGGDRIKTVSTGLSFHNLSSGAGNSALRYNSSTGAVSFDSTITLSSGNVSITDGNLVVASGHGIDFSATSDAGGKTSELLDDYEEGTFTPTFFNLDVPSHVTTDHYSYTKIGRLVHIEFQFTVSSSINDVSGFRFSLPFGTFGDRNIIIPCTSNKTGSGAVPFSFFHNDSGTNVLAVQESGGFVALSYNHFSGNILVGGGTYETDA